MPQQIFLFRVHNALDRFSGLLICLSVIFAPWAYGGTQPWTMKCLNLSGYALGALLIAKLFCRRGNEAQARWITADQDEHPRASNGKQKWIRLLLVLSGAFVLYCAIYVINARSTYSAEFIMVEHPHVSWLPSSFDRKESLVFFLNYSALACFFWGLFDWLGTKSAVEYRQIEERTGTIGKKLPQRLRLLLLVLAVNTAAVGLEGIIQRLAGVGKPLFFTPVLGNADAYSIFGPFIYRSTAAQYFNMAWPALLGFWWMLRSAERQTNKRTWAKPVFILTALVAVAAFACTSRAGAAIAVFQLIVISFVFWRGSGRNYKEKVALLSGLGVILILGVVFAWNQLSWRFDPDSLREGYQIRGRVYEIAELMAEDYPLFGTGPGAAEAVFQLYRSSFSDEWVVPLHNDWLETRVSFGLIGLALLLWALSIVFVALKERNGIYVGARLPICIIIGLVGCLAHAKVDYPFQVYATLQLFLTLCAILFTISAKPRRARSAGR